MTPLPHAENDIARIRYNRCHKSTRQAIECAFGILKKRFPCLKLLRVQPLFAAKIIMACATLHNLASQEDFEFEPPNQLVPNGVNNAPNIVPNIRQQEILNYFA
jgi:DDE superfamily endonuclease